MEYKYMLTVHDKDTGLIDKSSLCCATGTKEDMVYNIMSVNYGLTKDNVYHIDMFPSDMDLGKVTGDMLDKGMAGSLLTEIYDRDGRFIRASNPEKEYGTFKHVELVAYDKDNDREDLILDFEKTPVDDIVKIGRKINALIRNDQIRTDKGEPYDWLLLRAGYPRTDLVFTVEGGLEDTRTGKEVQNVAEFLHSFDDKIKEWKEKYALSSKDEYDMER